MAVRRSVLEIDVQDEKFKTFLKDYQKFQASAAKLPAIAQAFAAGMAQQQANARRAAAAASAMANESGRLARSWAAASRYTKDVYTNVTNTVARLGRFVGISGGVSGLIGGLITGGAIWGLERLAGGANQARRQTMGLGLGYGQQKAFGLAYERLIDSTGFLGGVSTGRGNIASGAATALYTLGINPMGGGNTGDVAQDALARIRNLAKKTPESQLGIIAQGYNLGELGIGVEDLRRLRTMSDAEFKKYQQDYTSRSKSLDVQDDTLRKWQDLDVQLDAAGQKIKKIFVDGLVPLAEPLGKLSNAFGDMLKSIVGSGMFKDTIEAVASGLKWFGEYLSDGRFKEDVKVFVESIGMLARKTVEALRWLGLIPDAKGSVDPTNPGGTTPAPPPKMLRDTPGSPFYKDRPDPTNPSHIPLPPKARSAPTMGWGSIKNFFDSVGSGLLPDLSRNPYRPSTSPSSSTPGIGRDFAGVDSDEMKRYAAAIAGIESAGQPNNGYGALGPLVKGDRAYGKYQVMGSNIPGWTKMALGRSLTAEEFLNDPVAQDRVFEHMFGSYIKKYGNFGDAASMWHSGRPLSKSAGANDGYISTHEYVRRASMGLPAQGSPRVTININDATGGKVNVTTGAMAVAQ